MYLSMYCRDLLRVLTTQWLASPRGAIEERERARQELSFLSQAWKACGIISAHSLREKRVPNWPAFEGCRIRSHLLMRVVMKTLWAYFKITTALLGMMSHVQCQKREFYNFIAFSIDVLKRYTIWRGYEAPLHPMLWLPTCTPWRQPLYMSSQRNSNSVSI